MTVREEIEQLKKEKNAVILAHYYVRPEIQEIADYTGDSFYLSKIAVGLKEQIIVFCGVSFMGESAKVLNPEKTVLMPDAAADCPMAHMADAGTIERIRGTYEDLAVVCYINSTAELKRYSDVCVTSANAVEIVKALPNKNIFFIPDRNLARHVASQVPEKNFIFNEGFCPVHEKMSMEEILKAKTAHPDALVLTHPECPDAVCRISDYIGSTSGIIRYAGESSAREFIVCTESGVRYELEKKCPDKKFWFPETEPLCMDMKTITLEKVLHVLKTGENEVLLDDSLRLQMVEAATAGYPKFKACDFEFHLPRPSYTVDTLRRLREAYPQREFVLIIGADNWTSFDRWKCPEEILSHHPILIYPRSGHPVVTETLPSGVRLINTPLMEISSTFIREAIGQGKDIRFFLHPEVYRFIREHRLYQAE